ncbi:glycosyltransferase family 2 protein [Enterococcus mediterraneensis]|uniref:glycosyltransferase family 2 protein n=1 Tax=Enterococcus mediterraneensis TaxID=2364791 RepID=UPI0013DFC8BC|nr:glycosyltransferase [Enterococcus mediterraneensis]
MDPLISIIVPVYNSEKTIGRCIDSILNQKYKKLELILVDDGSQDGSLQICKEYKDKDSRIVIITQSNSGVSKARNYGMQVSSGEFLSFVDSDDYLEADFYQFLVTKLISSGVDVITLSKYTIKQSNILEEIIDSDMARRKLLLLELPTSVWAYLYKANTIKNCRFSEEVHFFEDLLFNFDMLRNIAKLKLVSYEGYHYVYTSNSANNSALSDKKMSCLLIPDLINDNTLNNECIFFKSHCLVALILSLIKSNQKSYFKKISSECKKINIRKNKLVPIEYKILIYGMAFFPRTFINLLRIFRGG